MSGDQTGNFPALDAHFQQRLRTADRVVVAGVVCHERVDEAKRASRLAIRDRWDNWQHAGRLVTIPKFMADLSFVDLARELGP